MIKLVLIFVVCMSCIQAQIPVQKCPEITSVQQNFDLNRFFGAWYQEEVYYAAFAVRGRCNAAEYSLNLNGTIRVYTHQIDKVTGKWKKNEGYAKPAGNKTEGKWVLNISGEESGESPYWILETDYDHYAVIWTCVENSPTSGIEFAWIYTRERIPSQEVVDKAKAVFDRLNLSKKELVKIEQTNC